MSKVWTACPSTRAAICLPCTAGKLRSFASYGRAPVGFDDDAIYQQHTYNIAYRTHGDERLFVSKSFDCSVSLEAVLF